VMVGSTRVSPGAGSLVLVWKNTASPEELITPGPDDDPLLPLPVSVQSPTTSKGPPVQPVLLGLDDPPQLMVIAQVKIRQAHKAKKANLRIITPLLRWSQAKRPLRTGAETITCLHSLSLCASSHSLVYNLDICIPPNPQRRLRISINPDPS